MPDIIQSAAKTFTVRCLVGFERRFVNKMVGTPNSKKSQKGIKMLAIMHPNVATANITMNPHHMPSATGIPAFWFLVNIFVQPMSSAALVRRPSANHATERSLQIVTGRN